MISRVTLAGCDCASLKPSDSKPEKIVPIEKIIGRRPDLKALEKVAKKDWARTRVDDEDKKWAAVTLAAIQRQHGK